MRSSLSPAGLLPSFSDFLRLGIENSKRNVLKDLTALIISFILRTNSQEGPSINYFSNLNLSLLNVKVLTLLFTGPIALKIGIPQAQAATYLNISN